MIDPLLLVGGLRLATAAWWLAAAAHRLAPRWLPIRDAGLAESALRAGLLACLLMIGSTAFLGALGILHGNTVLASALIVYLASRRVRGRPASRHSRARSGWPIVVPAIATSGLVAAWLLAYLPAPPSNWDALTYHLFFPARWLQEARLFHIPTVFSDNAAAFAPQNGALFFAWQMALLGRDATCNVSQLLALALLALALFRCCRLLGLAMLPSQLGALTVPWLFPLARWTFSANVDVLMLAFWLAGLAWSLAGVERPEHGTLLAAGLATGLAAGTKVVGLALVLLHAVPLAIALAASRRGRVLLVFSAGALAGGGWWYLWSTWRYGNPLFPVALGSGPWAIPGAYGSDAIRAGDFHAEGWAAIVSPVWRDVGAGGSLVMLCGLAGLVALALSSVRRRAAAGPAILLLALLWAAFYIAVLPHNTQTRFLLPVLVLSLVGWVRILDVARRFHPSAAVGLALAGMLAAARPASLHLVGATFQSLADAGTSPLRWSVEALVCIAATVLLLRLLRRSRQPPKALALGAAALAITLSGALAARAAETAAKSRTTFWTRAPFSIWSEAFLPFHAPGAPATTIAYTGGNIPYSVMGEGWRNRVVYVNVAGESDDTFFDFWRRDPRRHAYHKPGLYRRGEELFRWLEHLDASGAELLVVFAMVPVERRTIRFTPEGFPIEAAWAAARPDRFEPLFEGRAARIYRLVDPSP